MIIKSSCLKRGSIFKIKVFDKTIKKILMQDLLYYVDSIVFNVLHKAVLLTLSLFRPAM